MPLILGIVAFFAFSPSFAQVRGHERRLRGAKETDFVKPSHVLVFDAGSSGTRIHVFNIVPGKASDLVPRIDLAVRDRQTKKIKPGLSQFAEKEDLAGTQKNIEQLLEFADQFVPEAERSSTPALLKATAGLRAVKPAENALAVLNVVKETLAKSGFLFQPEWADIIKGKEEAGLAWVAANYLQGSFSRDATGVNSLGVIEMGGGSTQVTFEVDSEEASRVASDDSFTFTTLNGQSYHLYAHSYLGYGMDYAQSRLRTAMQGETVEDPCYPEGYLRQAADDASSVIKGTGNAEACQHLIRTHLFGNRSETGPGRYKGELQLRGHLVATENFFYVRDNLKLPLDGAVHVMKEAAEKGCQRIAPSADEEAAMQGGTADVSKPNGCFGLSYQVALLDALQVTYRPGVHVEIARQIKGGDIDWALGAALMHFIDRGMGETGEDPVSLPMRIALVIMSLLGMLGFIRFFVAPRCTTLKQVQHAGSQIVANTFGAKSYIRAAAAE